MTIWVSQHQAHAIMRDRLREADQDRLARLATSAARRRTGRDRRGPVKAAAWIVGFVERVRGAAARRRAATAVGC